MKKQNCPRCGQSVEVRYKDMKRSDIDPWVYVEHTRPEVWGGELMQKACPGSEKNNWMALNTM